MILMWMMSAPQVHQESGPERDVTLYLMEMCRSVWNHLNAFFVQKLFTAHGLGFGWSLTYLGYALLGAALAAAADHVTHPEEFNDGATTSIGRNLGRCSGRSRLPRGASKGIFFLSLLLTATDFGITTAQPSGSPEQHKKNEGTKTQILKCRTCGQPREQGEYSITAWQNWKRVGGVMCLHCNPQPAWEEEQAPPSKRRRSAADDDAAPASDWELRMDQGENRPIGYPTSMTSTSAGSADTIATGSSSAAAGSAAGSACSSRTTPPGVGSIPPKTRPPFPPIPPAGEISRANELRPASSARLPMGILLCPVCQEAIHVRASFSILRPPGPPQGPPPRG